ncbi:MAG TPA: hypothetical protein VH682_22670 [Gemmataceae bacterium]|jgi:hypothetical protein
MNKLFIRAAWLGTLLVMAVGCGNKGLHPVHGEVHFPDGTPLTHGRVAINSVNGIHGASSDPLGPDGSFTLGSFKPDDGVPVGQYTVCVTGAVQPPASEAEALGPPKYLIHQRFTDPAKSGLTFEVKADGDNVLDITVEKPPAKR